MTHPCQFFPVGDPSTGGGGLDWSEAPKTTDFASENGKGYPVDTTSGPVTMTLPTAPEAGDQIGWKDYENNFQNAEFYADPGAKPIEGQTGPLKVTSRGAGGTLVFIDDDVGWLLVDHTPLDGGTVTNKPFMRVEDRKSSGTAGGSTSANTYHDRDLNTVVVNEISGASLANNEITLPVGEYHVEWYSPSSDSGNAGFSELRNAANDAVFSRSPQAGSGSADSTTLISTGTTRLVLTAPTTIKVVQWAQNALASFGLGRPASEGTEHYTQVNIWKLDTEIKKITVQDPQQYLKKPLLHVAHTEAPGVDAGSTIAGANYIPLNTIRTNEIAGATLSGNYVSLPAGEYFAEGWVPGHVSEGTEVRCVLRDDSSNAIGFRGSNSKRGSGSGSAGSPTQIKTRFTLTETTLVGLTFFTDVAKSGTGLGINMGSATEEVYGQLLIWSLDSVVQAPRVHQPVNQPISGAYVTGGIYGGELEYDDATHVNVKPVSCMSDDLTTPLYIDAVTNIAMSLTADTVYNFFIVRYDNATFGIEYDTDVNGANLPGNVTHKRWLGFVRANSTPAISRFTMDDEYIRFADRDDWILANNPGAAAQDLDPYLTGFMPKPRIKAHSLSVVRISGSTGYNLTTSVDGFISSEGYFASSGTAAQSKSGSTSWGDRAVLQRLPYNPARQFDLSGSNTGMCLVLPSVWLKR